MTPIVDLAADSPCGIRASRERPVTVEAVEGAVKLTPVPTPLRTGEVVTVVEDHIVSAHGGAAIRISTPTED